MSHRVPRTLFAFAAVAFFGCGTDAPMDVIEVPEDGLTVGGTITGHDAAVTLSMNGTSETFSAATFTFTQTLSAGTAYLVQFVSSATGQSCTVTNGIGFANANVTNVAVECAGALAELRYTDAEVLGALAAGDLDGDGNQDLVLTIRTSPSYVGGADQWMYRVLFGTGGGAYAAPVDIARLGDSAFGERGRQLTVLDLDGDAGEEFALAGGIALEVYSFGPTRSPTRIHTGEPMDRPLVALDVDGDGDQDLLTIVWGGSNLNFFGLYRNNGDGTFGAEELVGNRDDPPAQALGIGSPSNFTTGDFDGDGVEDILAMFVAGVIDPSLALVLLSGDGSGGFTYPTALVPLNDDLFLGESAFDEFSKEIAAGDFDDDGDLDVAITSTTDFLQLLVNDGSGGFTASGRVTVGTRPIHVRAADFDMDGTLDLLAANADSRDLVLAFGLGGGDFGAPAGGDAVWRRIQLDSEVEIYDIVVTDLDGDGTPDIAVAEDGTNPSGDGRGSVQILLAPGS